MFLGWHSQVTFAEQAHQQIGQYDPVHLIRRLWGKAYMLRCVSDLLRANSLARSRPPWGPICNHTEHVTSGTS